ncbi:flagellar protein FliT [Sulfuritalea sp.]|jgi:flagellar protein FliT|uniref:flagellar protein FliT n=1 Tax=Sulfuritalea sp. TaxID=2480090 RepID=UPI0025E8326B|nr:flagellar protein FliT [Sulfuritalea sp.]
MLSMPSHIDRYEEACALSARMVRAARSGEWDLLIALEARVAALRDGMMAESEASPEERLVAPEIARKRGLIQQLLDDDAEIRRHTEPWMEHVRKLLGDHGRRRRVQQAYGATDSPDPGFDSVSRA